MRVNWAYISLELNFALYGEGTTRKNGSNPVIYLLHF
ncbi:hypothetical protein NVP1022O_01, partial [Vibrio phage 1.022.O._10N.286.45.A10]